MSYTHRRNINRGYMKLDVWTEAMDLFRMIYAELKKKRIDRRLKSQIVDAAQSMSSNVAEGYCRRSINEYLQFLSVSLGSAGEVLTRVVGLKAVGEITEEFFEEFDAKHYSLENKLLALIASLQEKRRKGTWEEELKRPETE
jgi:four helix bundle protein